MPGLVSYRKLHLLKKFPSLHITHTVFFNYYFLLILCSGKKRLNISSHKKETITVTVIVQFINIKCTYEIIMQPLHINNNKNYLIAFKNDHAPIFCLNCEQVFF